MAKMDKYASYSTIQFATDAAFISWVKRPNATNNLFWREYLALYPSQADTVGKAKSIVSQMHFVEEKITEGRAVAIWNNIRERISVMPVRKVRAPVVSMKWIAAAAAVVFLMVFGFWFLVDGNKIKDPSMSGVQHLEDITPGGNKAILTLADGSEIILNSANNGVIREQGSVTVIKLDDGQLSYQNSTSQFHNPSTLQYNTLTTPKGGQYQVELADGSKVWLNATSSLRFPTAFVGNERNVELTGEGYFEIAPNATKPFQVKVDDISVRVLGTHFNINSYSDEPDIKTTLLEGRVSVSKGDRHINLSAGQQAIASAGENTIKVSQNHDQDGVVAWKNGYFHFDGANLQELLRQISRWYDVEVEYKGTPENRKFSGEIARTANFDDVIKVLKESKVQFSLVGKKLIVSQKPK